MAKSTTLSTLELQRPIDFEALDQTDAQHTRALWRSLGLSAAAIAAVTLLAYLWDTFSLPTVELNGHGYSWLLPLQIAVTYAAVRVGFAAVAEHGSRKRESRRVSLMALLQEEAIPFVASELSKLDGIGGRKFTLPPTDWLCRQMTVGPPQGATWSSRIFEDGWLSFAVKLEENGRRVTFAVDRPEGV